MFSGWELVGVLLARFRTGLAHVFRGHGFGQLAKNVISVLHLAGDCEVVRVLYLLSQPGWILVRHDSRHYDQ